MKKKIGWLTMLVLIICCALPQTALAKIIEFEAVPGSVWSLTIPDEFFATQPTPTPVRPTVPPATPSATPSPTPAPTAVPSAPTPTATLAPTQTPTPSPSPTPTPINQTQQNAYEFQMLRWVNAERAKSGLAPYSMDMSLTYWARAKSQDMVDKKYFSHTSPTYGSSAHMLKSAGISVAASAENIARFGSLEKAHAGLMSSAGHHANIMSKSMKRAGIGVVRTTDGVFYVTQLFVR